jgi:Heavy metal binding domain
MPRTKNAITIRRRILFDILSTQSVYKWTMRIITIAVFVLSVGLLRAQVQTTPNPSKDPVYFCPMDRDIRSNAPGNCSRCGMKLVAGVPDPVEYHLDLTVTPRVPKPGEKVRLRFDVHDPWKNNPVKKFNIVHEKLFHAFIVS